ncbi:MAG: hypothetical protein ACTTJ3_01605 [Treponema sp.]
MFGKNCIIAILFFLSSYFLNALSFGFSLDSENIFLNKNDNPYYPEIVSSFEASLFLSHVFTSKNSSLSITPGFFIDSTYNAEKKELNKLSIFPFFKYFNLSVFAEYLSFSFAKDVVSFGEGFFHVNDYFSLNRFVKKTTPIYHILFEVPINQASFSLGSSMDTKSIDHFKQPKWYQIWFRTFYSNMLFSMGFESDVLFDVAYKDHVFKMASEFSFTLPLDFKIYTSGRIPISLHSKKVTNWGVFAGSSKSFTLEDYNFTSILGLSYSNEGVGYSIFQNIGIKEIITFTLGLQGANKNNLYLIFENTFFISSLKFRLSYITKNLIRNEDMQGIFSIGVSLND